MDRARIARTPLIVPLALTLMLLCLSPASAFAKGNGMVLRKSDTSGTHMFALGDSRTYQIFGGSQKRPGYWGYGLAGGSIAVWGGRYSSQGGGRHIDTAGNRSYLKRAVQRELARSGQAYVFVMATVNIKNFGVSGYRKNVKAQIEVAKRVYRWTASYRGQEVHPKVWCTSLIAWTGNVSGYNKYLASLCAKTPQVGYCKVSNGGGFVAWNDRHYTKAGAKRVWACMHRTAGHIWGKGKVLKKSTLTQDGSLRTTCSAPGCGKRRTTKVYRPVAFCLDRQTYVYDGARKEPAVTVTDARGDTVGPAYYTVAYKDNVEIGRARAIITFKGRYSGTKTLTFDIVQGAP